MRGALCALLLGGCSLMGLYEAPVCPQGAEDCDGECVDIENDPENCGACELSCGDREYCDDGACVCRPGLDECDGECVDLHTDPAHCGDCLAAACPAFCVERQCSADCGQDECDRSCVDTNTDPLNCGSCGEVCAGDQVCIAGGCWDYLPAVGCESCDGCDACVGEEICCDLPGYGTSCVDQLDACP